jgi:flagellar biosynthesis/type III secretory pathway protein FliH
MARVIRGGGSRVVPAEVLDARAQAERIRSQAREQVESMRASALEGIAEEAARTARAELAAGWAMLESERASSTARSDQDVITLAAAIARRLVEAELSVAPERIREIARSVLARVPRATRIEVRANPDDVEALAPLKVEVVADRAIARGGCVVRTDLGDLDARIETRVDALLAAIAKSRR